MKENESWAASGVKERMGKNTCLEISSKQFFTI